MAAGNVRHQLNRDFGHFFARIRTKKWPILRLSFTSSLAVVECRAYSSIVSSTGQWSEP